MALQIVTNIDVDFSDKKYILINTKQLDRKTRFISFTCYNRGELYPINAGEHSAYIRYKKSDNNSVFNLCNIDRKGKILAELTEQMLASDGLCYADLVIVNKGSAVVDEHTGAITMIDGSGILSTMTFCIDVSETAVENSDIESSYEYNGLNKALEKAEAEYSQVIRMTKSYAMGNAGGIRGNEEIDNAKYYYEQAYSMYGKAKNSADNAAASAGDAAISRQYAAQYMNDASTFANNAKNSETSASESAGKASQYMQYSSQYMTEASTFSNNAKNSETSASQNAAAAAAFKSEAYNYYLQAEAVVGGLNGAFLPKGTITFDELIELKNNHAVSPGYLYQISDDFTTDENFRIFGKNYGAGTSVYYTVDNQFDCFVGTTVAGVKGSNESWYRTGMVNITPENIGAISNVDIATVDEMKNYLGI